MKKKTTMDVCAELGVSRTTLKGWVYDILDRTQEQNDKTVLEFTEDEIAKLWLIRFYKQQKYSNSQIKECLNSPDFNMQSSLSAQINELVAQKEEIENLIKVANIMKDTGLPPASIRFGFDKAGKPKYEWLLTFLEEISENAILISQENVNIYNTITEEDAKLLSDNFKKLMRIAETKFGPGYSRDQTVAKEIHKIVSKYSTESTVVLLWNLISFVSRTDYPIKINNKFGEGCAEYLYKVMHLYCKQNSNNDLDRLYSSAMKILESLELHHFKENSDEVQDEVNKLFRFVKKVNKRTNEECIWILHQFGEILKNDEMRNLFDNNSKRFHTWFIPRAIEIYCDNASNNS